MTRFSLNCLLLSYLRRRRRIQNSRKSRRIENIFIIHLFKETLIFRPHFTSTVHLASVLSPLLCYPPFHAVFQATFEAVFDVVFFNSVNYLSYQIYHQHHHPSSSPVLSSFSCCCDQTRAPHFPSSAVKMLRDHLGVIFLVLVMQIS